MKKESASHPSLLFEGCPKSWQKTQKWTQEVPKWCEALSFRFDPGGQHWKTGGSSTLYGLDPFGPIFLPLKERSRSHSGMVSPWFLTIFRMAFTIFSWRDRKGPPCGPYWWLFWGSSQQKTQKWTPGSTQMMPNEFQMISNQFKMNFEAFRNHNFKKFENSKILDFDPENTLRRPKIHQSGTRLKRRVN